MRFEDGADSNSHVSGMQEAVARVVDGQLDTILVRGTELEDTIWTQIEPVLPSGAADLLRPSHPFLDDWDTVNEPIAITEPEPTYLDTEVEAPIVVGRAAMPTAESRSSAALVQLRGAVIDLQVREHACPHMSFVIYRIFGKPQHCAHHLQNRRIFGHKLRHRSVSM